MAKANSWSIVAVDRDLHASFSVFICRDTALLRDMHYEIMAAKILAEASRVSSSCDKMSGMFMAEGKPCTNVVQHTAVGCL